MAESLKNKDKLRCVISAIIIIGCYAAERFIALSVTPGKIIYLVEAMIFSIAIAIVYFVVTKAENSFYGILPAILGLRMLPPTLSKIGQFSPAGEIVYYVVGKFSIIIFALTLVNLYKKQEKDNKISIFAILALTLIVPFSNQISGDLAHFALGINSSMLYPYIINFICYTAALIVILFIGTKSNQISAKLIADYTMVALSVNFARRAIIVVYNLINSNHVSKSYYCWLAIYVFFLVAFYVLRKKNITKAA